MLLPSAAISSSSSTVIPDGVQILSSSRDTANSPAPRLRVCFALYLFRARFRDSFPRKALRDFGRFGGMDFHACKYVSFTFSSLSEKSDRIFRDIFIQYPPYLSAVSLIACSFRCQYKSTILLSSICVLLSQKCHHYNRQLLNEMVAYVYNFYFPRSIFP